MTVNQSPQVSNSNSLAILLFYLFYYVFNLIAHLGPKTQCNKMWHVRRRYTTAFYLIMLIAVFAVAVAVSLKLSCTFWICIFGMDIIIFDCLTGKL